MTTNLLNLKRRVS